MGEILWRRELLLQLEIFHIPTAVLALIPVLFALVLQLLTMFTSSGRRRILAMLGFFITLFLVIPLSLATYGILLFFDYLSWQLVYGPIYWMVIGVSPLFLVYYSVVLAFPDLFKKYLWLIILPILGFVVLEIVAILALWTFLFYTVMVVYNTIYILIIPLIATYYYLQLERIRGTPRVKWILIITLGVVLWFIALAIMYFFPQFGLVPSFPNPGILVPLVIGGIGWWNILLGSLMDRRAGRQGSN